MANGVLSARRPAETNRFGGLGDALPRPLVAGSLFYLVVPAILQLVFWLRVPLAVGLGLAVLLAWPALRSMMGSGPAGDRWTTAFPIGVGVAMLAGAGGLFTYSGDWRKHYALLRDLTTESWPVIYQLPEGDGVLAYSLGWYMPAALVGRVFGWTAANVAIWAWLALGVMLVMWWAIELVGTRRAALVLLVFSGLDILGAVLLPRMSRWPPVSGDTLETWPGEWQVPSLLRGFVEAPQHSLPTLITAGLVLGGSLARAPVVVQLALLALLAVSSPFAVVAVLPFMVLLTLRTGPRLGSLPVNVGALGIIAAVGVLYGARLSGPPAGIPNEVQVGFTFLDPRFPQLGADNLAIAFVLVVLLEILVLAVAAWIGSDHGPQTRALVATSAVVMVVCLVVRVGHNNDLAMRGPGMAVFVLGLLVAGALQRPKATIVWRGLLVVVMIGAATGLVEIRRSMTAQPLGAYSVTSAADTAGLVEMKELWYPDRDSLLSQYLVAPDGLASRFFATN